MDKQLYINILDVLQQSNAINKMVDIKPAFNDELDTQEKRKNFKAQLDYLVSEGLIETDGKYDFLGWQLLSGLYPIDNKKIEARLAGKWQSHVVSKRGVKSEPPIIPMAAPTLAPVAKLGLYDTPSAPINAPGFGPQQLTDEPLPVNLETNAAGNNNEDGNFLPFKIKNPLQARAANNKKVVKDDFLPFKVKTQRPENIPASPLPLKTKSNEPGALPANDSFLKENDFLPLKTKNDVLPVVPNSDIHDEESDFLPFKAKSSLPEGMPGSDNFLKEDDFLPFKNKSIPAEELEYENRFFREADFLPANAKRANAARAVANNEQLSTDEFVEPSDKHNPVTTPATEKTPIPPVPSAPVEFSPLKFTYSPPKVDVKPMEVTANAFKPAPAQHNIPAGKLTPERPSREAELVPPPVTEAAPVVPDLPNEATWATPLPINEPTAPVPRIIPAAVPRRAMPSDPDEPILTARTASLLAAQPLPEPEDVPPPPAVVPEVVREVVQPKVVKFASQGAPMPKLVHAAPVQRNVVLPPPSNYPQNRFDTDNNPFADLSTITLANDSDKPKQIITLAMLLKWAIAAVVFMGLILVYLLTKKRY